MGKCLLLLPVFINANIYVYKNNATLNYEVEYESIQANFGDDLPEEGLYGQVELAQPLNACSPLNKTNIEPSQIGNRTVFPVLLAMRGECQFDAKVKAGQDAGYQAVIIFDNQPNGRLIPMGSQGDDEVEIPSVFCLFEQGSDMMKAVEKAPLYVKLTPDGFNPYIPKNFLLPFAMAVGSCLLIMLISTVLVRDWRKSRKGRLSRRKLNQLPIIKFKQEEHGDKYDTCAICLEDFKNGDKVRVLPCKHGYHKTCIDPWLTSNRKVCPLCKRIVLPSSDDSDVSDSEEAPLLENEVPPPQDSPRVIGWARGFANRLDEARRSMSADAVSESWSGSESTRPLQRDRRRSRTISDRSYESTGDLTEPTPYSVANTVSTQNQEAGIEIRPRSRSVDHLVISVTPYSVTEGDDESSPPLPRSVL